MIQRSLLRAAVIVTALAGVGFIAGQASAAEQHSSAIYQPPLSNTSCQALQRTPTVVPAPSTPCVAPAAIVVPQAIPNRPQNPTPAPTGKQAQNIIDGPAAVSMPSPYDDALICLKEHLTPEQMSISYGVAYFADQTGKTNIAAQDASGAFLSQGYDLRLITGLKKIGVRIVNVSPVYRTLMEQSLKYGAGGHQYLNMLLPDVMVGGGFDVLDVLSSRVAEASIGLSGGHRDHSILIGYDVNATAMPFNHLNADSGEVLTAFGYSKQIIGHENQLGLTSFFGGGAIRTLLSFNLDKQINQPLQYAAGTEMDAVAYRLVRDITRVTACDEVFRMSETDAHIKVLAKGT